MDYKEVIRRLDGCVEFDGNLLDDAADAIETLLAERDAALEELRSIGCEVCAHLCDYSFNSPCCTCGDADNNWQWRGPQKHD